MLDGKGEGASNDVTDGWIVGRVDGWEARSMDRNGRMWQGEGWHIKMKAVGSMERVRAKQTDSIWRTGLKLGLQLPAKARRVQELAAMMMTAL